MSDRLDVRKTYKLLINGALVRSESGRSYEVASYDGSFLANVAQASRKDVREAVEAARAAQSRWWALSAYNRGQVLYRVAEMAEARRHELTEQVARCEGLSSDDARACVARSIDRIVWYAGWTDKIAQVLGSANPVAGPFFNFSVPQPTGVVGVLADQDSSLEAFVDAVFAPVCAGNAVVVLASETRPSASIVLGEITTTADLPGGVVNVLSGLTREMAPTLAAHEDVDGIDLASVPREWASELALTSAGSIKRVLRAGPDAGTSLRRLRAFVEISTVWHTIGQ